MVRNSSYALLAAQQSSGNFAGANEEYFKGWALSYHTFSNHVIFSSPCPCLCCSSGPLCLP
eukprot:749573-Hanusia_phi.AAC.2